MKPKTRSASGSERRAHRRYAARFPVRIDAVSRTDRFGMTRDVSVQGALVNTPSRFGTREPLTLTLLLPSAKPRAVRGVVVRVGEAAPGMPWRYVTAVRFDEPLTELEADLATLADGDAT